MSRGELITIINKRAIPDGAPGRVFVIPWGDVQSKSGDFIVDEAVAQSIIARFESMGVPLVIDLEHQTVGGKFSSPDGAAPAMGWINSFEPVPGEGIYANVEWTERGAGYVRSKE